MGIRFTCPSGHKLHVKSFLAGKRGICPHCGATFQIPLVQAHQQSALGATRGGGQDDPVEALIHTNFAAMADISSASILIDVADEPAVGPTPADEESSMLLSDSFGSPASVAPVPVPSVPVPTPQPVKISDALLEELPVVRYVAPRRRVHRQQLNTAILLLAMVILLALILIWVLQYGATQSSTDATTWNRPGILRHQPTHIAIHCAEESTREVPLL
jgi:hypothetical protein